MTVGPPTGGDDTAVVHAARDAAGPGGRLHFPGGVYLTTGLNAYTGGQTWELSPGTIIRATAGLARPLVDVRGQDVTFRGGTFDGNRANAAGENAVGIYAETTGAGLRLDSVHVRSCAGFGIWSQVDRTEITGCHVTETTLDGIAVYPASGGQLADCRIAGTTVDLSTEPAASIAVGIHVAGAVRTRISDNLVKLPGNGSSTSSRAICIALERGSHDSTISGNITHRGQMGVSVDRSNHVAVSANIVNSPASSSPATIASYGIELADSDYATVTGNTVNGDGATTHGIATSDPASEGCVITGNHVHKTLTAGIEVNAADGTITGNGIQASAGRGISVVNTSRVTVSGNTIGGPGSAVVGVELWTTKGGTLAAVAVTGNSVRGCGTGIRLRSLNAPATFSTLLFVGNLLSDNTTGVTTSLYAGSAVAATVAALANIGIADQAGSFT